jgi:hypothetical protein
MNRRELIALLGVATAAWPLAARAQPAKTARIGFLGLVSASSHASRIAALRAGVRTENSDSDVVVMQSTEERK